ncbi:hypothetical protein N7G274_001984 [Stereocaulon virgatum]|uniref:Phospholipase/carboxylesterase/thioesterase domain-containing protein n=1 Tax=Stereocaulon virgatum TaxID=373712 RepID=A0ABR4AL69_9LECA
MSNASVHHPDPVIILPSREHTHTIIILHGLSTNGSIFSAQLLQTALNSAGLILPNIFPYVKFVFPSGGRRRCTALNSTMTNVWFDIQTIDDRTIGENEQVEGLRESSIYLHEIITAEIALLENFGKSQEDLALWGFSQGCAMGAWVMLSGGRKLGAFVGMSGWLPFRRQIDAVIGTEGEKEEKRRRVLDLMNDTVSIPSLVDDSATGNLAGFRTPAFLGHGSQDVKVKTQWGEEMRKSLKGLGMDVTWKGYEGLEHWWRAPEEIDDVIEFLRGKGF